MKYRKQRNLILSIIFCITIISGLHAATASIVVDDYSGKSVPGREWYYSRIGTDRGEMDGGSTTLNIGGGSASVEVRWGWAGVWTSLLHNARFNEELNPAQLLGPYIKSQYQSRITGIEVDIIDGSGNFKIELKNKSNSIVTQNVFQLSGGVETLQFATVPTANISKLNWLVDGIGHATVDEIRFVVDSPVYTTAEAVFLYTYSHLSQCYDPATGLVRDRARWPVEDFSSVQTIGTFALITAIAYQLGYIEESTARNIVVKTKSTIQSLPTYHGLLPHFVTNGQITANTEWSCIDTVITLVSHILACQLMGEETASMEGMLQVIDWADLSDNGSRSISMGYTDTGNKLDSRWDTFGSEAFLVAVAYCAATGDNNIVLEKHSQTPTWDGSGFNDEMAALFFPMNSTDRWGNDWSAYRQAAFNSQVGYFAGHLYASQGLFGLSASEVPEPWEVAEADIYSAWGIGGHNGTPNDGQQLVGYPIIAPHYAALVAKENPRHFNTLFSYLIYTKGIFSPLNNVETMGIDSNGDMHWNSLKGSWNLSLQALGVSRLLVQGPNPPYIALADNNFLKSGFQSLTTTEISVTSPNGGETWLAGTTESITWTSRGLSGQVNLELYKNGQFHSVIGTADTLTGSANWDIQTSLSPGNDYRIRISSDNVYDESNGNFTILPSPGTRMYPDFNNDGKPDILWRYYGANSSGINMVWYMDGINRIGTNNWLRRLADLNWKIEGTGDFNGDGKTDILWRYYGASSSGINMIWYMDGINRIGSNNWFRRLADLDWKIEGTGDFNGDGKTDILWRYYGANSNGINMVWYMDGINRIGSNNWLRRLADLNWKIEGTGDFNGDGKTDILWRYYGPTSTGLNMVWYMDGIDRIGTNNWLRRLPDPNWKIAGTGDFNGDGKTDILWRYYGTTSSGLNMIWYMDGITRIGSNVWIRRLPDLNWKIEQ
jgi:hypothetical protein